MQKVAIQFAPQRMFTSTQQRIRRPFFSRSHATAAIFPGHLDGPVPATWPFFQTYGSILKKIGRSTSCWWFLVYWVFVFVCFSSKISTRFDRFGGSEVTTIPRLYFCTCMYRPRYFRGLYLKNKSNHAMDKEICFKYFKHVQLLPSGKYIA